MNENPFAAVISAAELIARDDREGALILLAEAEVPAQRLAEAALTVFAGVMAGAGAAERFDELRGDVHRLAAEVGADDRQVVLNLEVIGAAQALERGDLERANAITGCSEFTAIDHAHVAVVLTGQAVAGWLGPERTPGFFRALRREYGIDDT